MFWGNPEYDVKIETINFVETDLAITGMKPWGFKVNPRQVEKARNRNFQAILNCANFDLPEDLTDGLKYLKLGLDDGHEIPETIIRLGIEFLQETHGQGDKVLVHCAAGISRSVGIAAAYIATRDGISLQKAIVQIRSRRSVANPHTAIRRSLVNYLHQNAAS